MIPNFNKLLTYGLEYFGLYYGVYRGQVMSTADPDSLGRVQVHCPTIHGPLYPPMWAFPRTTMGGKQFGFWHVPDVGEWVYVSFDHGRLDYPLWEGGWWGAGDPTTDMVPTSVVLATKEGLKIVLDRQNEVITIQQTNGNSIIIDSGEIIISHNSDIVLQAQGSVTINAHAQVNVTAQDKVSITAPEIDLTGNVLIAGNLGVSGGSGTNLVTMDGNIQVTGAVQATGDGTFNGIQVSQHVHGGVTTGSSTTAIPQG